MTHTKGQWKIIPGRKILADYPNNIPVREVIANGLCIALVTGIGSEEVANGKLITNAPELLEMCKTVLTAIEGTNTGLDKPLQALIAKIEGGS